MATEHFCLRWNNHQSTLVSVFDNLLESGTLVDCTLAADGRYLKAHKVVLSACSPYLGMLLSQHYDKHPIIILKDVKFDELKAMLDYMYRGEVNISQEQLSTFLKAAETLQIKGLTDTGAEEGIQPNRPPSSNSTTSAPTEEPLSPGSAGPNSPNPKKRKRNKPSDDPPDEKPAGSDQNASVSSLSALKNVSFGSVKREPTERDGDGDGVMSVDDSNDSAMMARPGPSNGSGNNNKGSPWILSADSGGEEMQLTPGQGQSQSQQQQQQQQYMQSMMQSFYGNMWMDGAGTPPGGPLDMDQEMLAAYRYGRPNWNANRYLCTTCGRTYSLQASLYNHKKFECGKMPNFICPYCPHRTKQKGNLKTHIKKRHPEFFTEPFMPSPSRLNSMMNTIMMQNTMLQQNNMLPSSSMQNSAQNSNMQNSAQNSAMQNSPMQSSSQRALMQNSQSMMNTSKPQNPSINNLLQAMKQQSQNAGGLSAASLVQALSQSLPNSTSISALDIMQVLAQGAPKNTPSTPVTPHRMSPMNASPATPTASNPPQSPMHNKMASPLSPMPQSPMPNGSVKSELPSSPAEMPSATPEPPKSPPTTFNTSLSLDPESEDSSDTPILPSYPITQ